MRVEYYLHYARPVKVVYAADGRPEVYRFTRHTGRFERDDDLYGEIISSLGGETDAVDEDRFIQETEKLRARYLHGDGPAFAVYDTIEAITKAAQAEGRGLTPDEAALIRELRRRTYALFESEATPPR